MSKISGGAERRCHSRYEYPENNNQVSTTLRSIDVSGCAPDDIRCTDYSRTGLGLESEHNIPVGTGMQLALSIADGLPVLLRVIVSNRRKKDDLYRYGAYFEYEQESSHLEHTEAEAKPFVQASFAW